MSLRSTDPSPFLVNTTENQLQTLSIEQTIGASNMLYANGRPNVVGPWGNPKGEVTWNGNNGSYFGSPSQYQLFNDPQCADPNAVQQAPTSTATADSGGFFLANISCTLRGLGQIVPAGTAGAIVSTAGTSNGSSMPPLLVNPLPGQQGNLGVGTMNTVSRWSLDASASKTFRVSESKSFAVRIDTSNVLNHPTSGDPAGLGGGNSLLAGTNFGAITTKTGSRTFRGSLRFSV
jgi:hypothetical protein